MWEWKTQNFIMSPIAILTGDSACVMKKHILSSRRLISLQKITCGFLDIKSLTFIIVSGQRSDGAHARAYTHRMRVSAAQINRWTAGPICVHQCGIHRHLSTGFEICELLICLLLLFFQASLSLIAVNACNPWLKFTLSSNQITREWVNETRKLHTQTRNLTSTAK